MMLKRLMPSLHYVLRRYFASGWAFLIPYLAVYLLYYATDWPVNPASDSESGENLASAMPSLLHVYWVLHVLHLALGAVALWASPSAKSAERKVKGEKNAPGGDNLGHALHHQPLRAMSSELLATIIRRFHSLFPLHSSIFRRPFTLHPSPFTLHSSLFWLLLALIFYIPGVYLEWPSDPWEHLRRINEWHGIATVQAHSCWYKSAYFIPYSLLSWATGLRQLFWLDFYYTGICLLLCWQYYRLSRACGLGDGASKIFVLIQAILFGNNIFSFYRYYGISSSIYAQIGAVAITRIVLEFAAGGTTKREDSLLSTNQPPFWHWRTLCTATGPALACIVPFIAFNHQQGIGIAALGVLAIAIWRIVAWKRTAIWWLIAGALIINALFLWLYPRPAVIEIYRTNGALNAWYGFSIFDFTHPIGDRMLQIVSAFGLVNILAALILLRHNHVSAWLTLTPLIALSLPCISIPFSEAISKQGLGNIITFQRMLFSIPLGLAVVQCTKHKNDFVGAQSGWGIPTILYLALVALVSSPSGGPSYNRAWNAVSILPKDLQLHHLVSGIDKLHASSENNQDIKIIANKACTALLSFYPFELIGAPSTREIGGPSSGQLNAAMDFLEIDETSGKTLLPQTHPAQGALANEGLNLVPAPHTCAPTRWMTLAGHEPKFGVQNACAAAIQNPKGLNTYVFTADLIPIQRELNYRLKMSVRQIEPTEATVFLAVAWYDAQKNLLMSSVAPPAGAGNPRGWSNGTYSYFGLVEQAPETTWTTYSISFGFHETAGIPYNARFIRVGALLNYNTIPNGEILLTNLRLTEKTQPSVIPTPLTMMHLCSAKSIAAQLSKHWPSQEVMAAGCGSREITEACSTTLSRTRYQNTKD